MEREGVLGEGAGRGESLVVLHAEGARDMLYSFALVEDRVHRMERRCSDEAHKRLLRTQITCGRRRRMPDESGAEQVSRDSISAHHSSKLPSAPCSAQYCEYCSVNSSGVSGAIAPALPAAPPAAAASAPGRAVPDAVLSSARLLAAPTASTLGAWL